MLHLSPSVGWGTFVDPNPEMESLRKWDELGEETKRNYIDGIRKELIRLFDCVEVWLPRTPRLTSAGDVRILVTPHNGRGLVVPEVPVAVRDAAAARLTEIALGQGASN